MAIEHACLHNTVYVSSVPFPIQRYLKTREGKGAAKKFFISEIHSVSELWFLVKHRLRDFVAREEIGLVVIDSLDHLLYTEKKDRNLCGMLGSIVRDLKNVIHRYSAKVIVINSWCRSRNSGPGWSLGLSWSYLVNTRLLIKKTTNERTCEALISVNGQRTKEIFVIDNTGVEFLNP